MHGTGTTDFCMGSEPRECGDLFLAIVIFVIPVGAALVRGRGAGFGQGILGRISEGLHCKADRSAVLIGEHKFTCMVNVKPL